MLVKKVNQNIFISVFTFMGIGGLLTLSDFNILPIKILFYFLIIISFIVTSKKILARITPALTILAFYVIYSFLIFFTQPELYFYDFLQAFLVFYYLLILVFFINSELFNYRFISKFYNLLLIFFFVKYSLSLTMGAMHRPGIFTENNFELVFLVLVFIINFEFKNKIEFYKLLVTILIFILSNSRSGIAIILFVIAMLYTKKSYFKARYVLPFFLVSLGVFFLLKNLFSRISFENFQQIDRFNFLMIFLDEIKEWGPIDYLFGNPILTKLSQSGCYELSYYEKLFSDSGDCYSVVFHAFNLRVIFDHGILGLLFIFYFLNKLLSLSKIDKRYRLTIIGVFLLNGFSVSSLNSQISLLGLILVLGTIRNKSVGSIYKFKTDYLIPS